MGLQARPQLCRPANRSHADDPKTKYFDERCYFTPSSCSFTLRCNQLDRNDKPIGPCPRSGNYLAADPNGDSPFAPTGFAQKNASSSKMITRFQNNFQNRLSVIQNGEQLFASVPRSDPSSANSIISFVPASAIGVTATPLNCRITSLNSLD